MTAFHISMAQKHARIPCTGFTKLTTLLFCPCNMANQHNIWSYEIVQPQLTTLTWLYLSEHLSNTREKYAFSCLKADGTLSLLINNAAQFPLGTATSSEHFDQLVQEKKDSIQFISLYFMSMAFF